GSLTSGERLNESILAAHFGTSRGPLREALQALGEQGLVSFYRRITRELHLFRLQGLYSGGAVPSNVEHWNILKAIQSGSAERAAAAMRTHIEVARARMLKAVKRRPALISTSSCDAMHH